MNHICSCGTDLSRSKRLNIRIPLTNPDPLLARVLHTLEILRESRFGPVRGSRLINHFDEVAETDPVFYDDWDGELVPCRELTPHGRFGYQLFEAAYREAKQKRDTKARPKIDPAPATAAPTAPMSPANPGRGSPF